MAKTKFHNKPFYDAFGLYWHSRGEYRRWQELKWLERAGEIKNLGRQATFNFSYKDIEIGKWIADFVYYEWKTSELVAEDFKGVITADFRRNVKCMKAWYPQWKIRVSSIKGVRDV